MILAGWFGRVTLLRSNEAPAQTTPNPKIFEGVREERRYAETSKLLDQIAQTKSKSYQPIYLNKGERDNA